ncbi:MAG: hypothetical protein M3O34_02605 [Chloroflexota bacterium]|nr:hypothetical protein [Chloroflexota bacterium]
MTRQLGRRAERPDLIRTEVQVHRVAAEEADLALPVLGLAPGEPDDTVLEPGRALVHGVEQVVVRSWMWITEHVSKRWSG